VLERRGEQQVVLEAIAAATIGDHLALQVFPCEQDGRPRCESRFSKGIEVAWARWISCHVGAVDELRPIRSRYAS
jgi:hypothetical protein